MSREQARIHAHGASELASLGRLAEAAAELALAIEEAPGDVQLRQRRADTLVQLGRVPEAIAELQHVAGHFAAAGRPFQAMAVNLVILELDPEHQETQGALADLFADRKSEPLPIVPELPETMSGALGAGGEEEVDPSVTTQPEQGPVRAQAAPVRMAPPPGPSLGDDEDEPVHTGVAAPGAARPGTRPPAADQRGHAPLVLQVGGLLRHATALQKPSRGGILPARPAPTPPPRPVALNVGALNRTPLFSALERDAFVALLGELEVRFVLAGQSVIDEGSLGTSMFVLVEGAVDVVRSRSPDGSLLAGANRTLVAQLAEGSFFGEMALFANSPRLATVVAVTDAVLLEIDREALDSVSARHPAVREVLRAFYRARLLDNLLAQSPLFREFTFEQKRALGERFRHHSLPKGSVLVAQGQPSTGLCVLLRGRCSVVHTAASGAQLEPQPLREGDVFGEISLLFDTPAVATVHADSPVEVLELPRDAFRALVLGHPSVRAQIERQARERLEAMRQGLAARGEWVSSTLV